MTHEITDGMFAEFLTKNTVVMLDCWAPWCGPCRMLSPVVDELANEYEGRLAVAKLNVDDNGAVAEQYGIMSIPTLLFFKNGELVDRMVGAQPKANIVAKINQLL